MRQKIEELLGSQEAIDNLAVIASINLEAPPLLGIVGNRRFVTDAEEFGDPGAIRWLSGEGAEKVVELLNWTYFSVHSYLQSLYDNPSTDWESQESKEGLASLMVLIGESAERMVRYLNYRLGEGKGDEVRHLPSFQSLQSFYSQWISKRFAGGVEGKEAWQIQWSDHKVAPERIDLEEIQQDSSYELFSIVDPSGKPYFDRKLLQNVQLTAEFDTELDSFEEDPFLKVRSMVDRDLNAFSRQILSLCKHEITMFYELMRLNKKFDLSLHLGQAILALFLAANPRHLLHHAQGKSASCYFSDFHMFLRACLKSESYQKWLVYPPESHEAWKALLMRLVHRFCFCLMEKKGGIKQEAIGLIYRTMRRGEKDLQVLDLEKKEMSLWNHFLFDDEKLRAQLNRFPGGPLVKILDLIRQETMAPFDPWKSGNLPLHVFDLKKDKEQIQVIRFPCPTVQKRIDRAEVIDEFRGYLHFLSEAKQKLFIVQFQNRLSWKEAARVEALESLQTVPHFSSHLFILTLPKSTAFYHQSEAFPSNAKEFAQAFCSILEHPQEHGFQFPPQWKKGIAVDFFNRAFPLILSCFFESKEILTRQDRENVIEIFYQLFICKAIELIRPHMMGFMCKDGLDFSAAESGCFYGMFRLLQGGLKDKKEIDFLRYLFYYPALFTRERALNAEHLHRSLAFLECLSRVNLKSMAELQKIVHLNWEVA